jgi:hypothetical protein
MASSAVLYFQGFLLGGELLSLGFVLTASAMALWFRDCVIEGTIVPGGTLIYQVKGVFIILVKLLTNLLSFVFITLRQIFSLNYETLIQICYFAAISIFGLIKILFAFFDSLNRTSNIFRSNLNCNIFFSLFLTFITKLYYTLIVVKFYLDFTTSFRPRGQGITSYYIFNINLIINSMLTKLTFIITKILYSVLNYTIPKEKILDILNSFLNNKGLYHLEYTVDPLNGKGRDNFIEQLGFYLAGLLEGEGHIAKPNELSSFRPRLIFTCHKNNISMYVYIQFLLGGIGRFSINEAKPNTLRYIISDNPSIIKIINLIHNKLRTPKNITLNNLIVYLNNKYSLTILPSLIDNSYLGSNS